MTRIARAEVFAHDEVTIVHTMSRVVRRCFLMGDEPVSGKNFDHRKDWIENELRRLYAQFAIDLLDFAILSNHFYLILRSRPDRLLDETAVLAASAYVALNPIRAGIAETLEASDYTSVQRRIEARMGADSPAQAAVATETGSVEHPPAAPQSTPPAAEGDSAKPQAVEPPREPDGFLAPVSLAERRNPVGSHPSRNGQRCSDKGFLAMTTDEYLSLLDWTARQQAGDNLRRLCAASDRQKKARATSRPAFMLRRSCCVPVRRVSVRHRGCQCIIETLDTASSPVSSQPETNPKVFERDSHGSSLASGSEGSRRKPCRIGTFSDG